MFVSYSLSACAVALTKLSIINSYLRVFPHQSLRITMFITMAITIGLMLASIPVTIFQCNPVRSAWDFTITNGRCYDFVGFLYASSAINTATDLILCTVPIRFLWSLKIAKKQKIVVSFLFFVGGLACVASVVRLAFLYQLRSPIDVLYNIVTCLLLTVTECTVGVVCVSLPPLRPMFAKCLPSLFNSTSHTTLRSSVARRQAYALGDLSSKPASQLRKNSHLFNENNSQIEMTANSPLNPLYTGCYYLYKGETSASLPSSDYRAGIAI